jgi:hypothetical protein
MTHDDRPAGAREGLFIASLILGLSLIACTVIAGRTFVRVKGFGQTIAVTGAAYKPIKSNYAIWEGWISATAASPEGAYSQLSKDRALLEAYLQEAGFAQGTYEAGGVSIMRNYNRDGIATDYVLRQQFRLELADIGRITDLSKNISSLIEKGVELDSRDPQYLFTGLNDVKLDMIRAATENAQQRAQQLAETTGRKVGAPTSASVGIFQIRPLHSQEVSDMGMSDVSSIDKEIVSTVHVSFLIED